MPIDAQTASFLEKASLNPPAAPGTVPLEVFREAVVALRPLGFEPEDVEEARDLVIPRKVGSDVRARLFRPHDAGVAPLVVWAHGGSWVRVTVDLVDGYFRFFARRSGCVILAVDYELAPESQFPGAVEEVYAAARWAQEHAAELGCDPDRIAIAGESSGGNLTAAVTLLNRARREVTFAHQLLLLPVLDARFASRSWDELGSDYLLTRAQLEWAIEQYAPGVDRDEPLLSPVRADSLAGLPPATIVVGEYDPLRDEGEQYAARLEADGVPVTLTRVPGLIHHAVMVPKAIVRGRRMVEDAAAALARALHVSVAATSDRR
jgi:acetyl esterase